ncbi:MAG: tripartite tricarboxylate transporter substrate binding protein [Xanthobacteraceae bacterium]
MQPNSHWAAIIGVAVLATLPASPARAQNYPTRTVTIVAPSAPGGMYSILARLIGGKLERLYGKSFVVENRPGASSVTGAVAVMRAPPDGYTLMVATSSTLATNVTLHKNLPYDPLTDFVPITLIALSPEVLLINASLPVRSIADLVKLARTTPGGLSFGSAGPGTAQHLNGELLKAALGVEMHHIPYKGIQPALNDLAGGHIALMSAPIPVALPLVQGARVRMLGVTTKERVEAIPDVPPLAEIGVPGYNAPSWFMLVAPAKTPRAIVDKLHGDLGTALDEADVREEFIMRQGLIPVRSPPPDELRRFVAGEIVRLGDIVRKTGLAGSE